MNNINKLMMELDKKPSTIKEKLEDYMLDIQIFFEKYISDPFYGIRRYFRNLIKFSKFLWRDYDWDYDFFLSVQRDKLEYMKIYHENSRICVENPEIAKEIGVALKLLDIIQDREEEFDEDKPLFYTPTYVNTRNAKRFMPSWDRMLDSDPPGMKVNLLRQEKAWVLYHKYLSLHLRKWWD